MIHIDSKSREGAETVVLYKKQGRGETPDVELRNTNQGKIYKMDFFFLLKWHEFRRAPIHPPNNGLSNHRSFKCELQYLVDTAEQHDFQWACTEEWHHFWGGNHWKLIRYSVAVYWIKVLLRPQGSQWIMFSGGVTGIQLQTSGWQLFMCSGHWRSSSEYIWPTP